MINSVRSAFDILPVTKDISQQQRGIFKERDKINKVSCWTGKDYYPYDLDLFLGPECNANCIYCFSHCSKQQKAKGTFLTKAEYMHVIDQAIDLGVKMVIFVGRGEPFMSDLLLPLVKYVDSKAAHAVIISNGTLITPEIAKQYYALNCSILVKLNSLNPAVQDEILGIPGMSLDLYRGMRILMDAGFNKSSRQGITRLSTNNVLTRLNYKEVQGIIKWAVSHNINPFLETLQWAGRATQNVQKLQLNAQQYKVLSHDLQQLLNEGWSWMGAPFIDGEICGTNRMPLFINEKGNVIPCWMREDIVIGNIRNESLKSLWQNEKLQKTRREHKADERLMKLGFVKAECKGRQHQRQLNAEQSLPAALKVWQGRYDRWWCEHVKQFLISLFLMIKTKLRKQFTVSWRKKQPTSNRKLKKFIDFATRKKRSRYDALVYCSGGKDSAYILYLLKFHYKLNVLAYTYMHPLLNDIARQNIHQITDIFKIDLIKRQADEDLYKSLVKCGLVDGNKNNAPPIIGCMSCSYFRETIALNLAIEKGIPLIATGLRAHQFRYPPVPDKRKSRKQQFYFHRFEYAQKMFSPMMEKTRRGTQYCFNAAGHEEREIPFIIHPLCVAEFIPQDIPAFLSLQFSAFKEVNLDPKQTNCNAVPFFDFFAYKFHNYSSYREDHKYKIEHNGLVVMWDEPLSERELEKFYIEEKKLLNRIARDKDLEFEDVADDFSYLCERFGRAKLQKYFQKYKTIHYYSQYFDVPLF